MENITIESLETLATELEKDQAAQRARLIRMIRAEARILAAREPDKFPRRATEYADEDGHYDNSYPPKQVYRARTGPRLVILDSCDYEDNATEGGFYHAWERVTLDPGIYVSRDGRIYGCEMTGTGRVGQFAAHPGDCDVDVTLEYSLRDEDEIPLEQLASAEETLRSLAFPLTQAVAS
jgi:hypothetical protein